MEIQIKKALSKVKQKKYLEAQKIYQKILRDNPNHLDANYLLGTLYAEKKMLPEAEKFLRKALLIEPNSAMTLTNLANVHKLKSQHQSALDLFSKALSLNPQNPQANYGLATMLEKTGAPNDVILSHYMKAVAVAPNMAEAHYGLAQLLVSSDINKAIKHFKEAESLNSRLIDLQLNIGKAFLYAGDKKSAIHHLNQAKKQSNNTSEIDYFLCIASDRAPDSNLKEQYIRDEFNGFAKTFDDQLTNRLDYRVPQQAYQLIKNHFGADFKFNHIVDLGCGTGLNGPFYKEHSKHLTGIDLSEEMLKVAKKKNSYTNLIKADIYETLKTSTDSFDLFIATDVVIYLGDLRQLFTLVVEKSTPNSHIILSTEHHHGTGFVLRESGRYAHSTAYLVELAQELECIVEKSKHIKIRNEHGTEIMGDLMIIKLPSAEQRKSV